MTRATQMDRRRWLFGAGICGAALWGLGACSARPPIRVGFLGGRSNQASSFSEEGRNAAILATERRNRAGGVGGRQIDLLVQDYGEGTGEATAAFRALSDAGVAAIIGPYSSSAAAELEPIVDQGRLLLLSPISRATATSRPGNFLVRIGRVRRDEALAVADMLYARGVRRLALAGDMRSAAYTTSWTAYFRQAFTALGGDAVVEVPFGLDAQVSFSGIARQLLATRPDAVLFVATAYDAARLAQHIAALAPSLPMTASGRAINPQLLEIGGPAVEGMVLVQPYNAADTSPRFVAFHADYSARFGQAPTYSAVVTFDAMTVLAEALARLGPDESVREAVFRHGPYQGLQETIRFDGVDDGTQRAFFSVVRNGRFEPLP